MLSKEYRNKLKYYRKMLRAFPTQAETELKTYLRSKGIKGLAFQKRLGKYIYDFGLKKYRILIEVDGGYHNTDKQFLKDYKKRKFANKNGWYLIRVKNKDVYNNIEQVYNKIQDILLDKEVHKLYGLSK